VSRAAVGFFLIGWLVFIGVGLVVESVLLFDEIEFVILYTSVTYPFLIAWTGLFLNMLASGDDT
jgi:hypothetical protein